MGRNVLVDRLKGYACFLVLFGHVIRGIRLSGIYIPEVFEGIELFIWSFHVALFLFLSGVVYKLTDEWRKQKSKSRFILHKALSLGIPYFVFSCLYIVINSAVGQVNTQFSLKDILLLWKTPIAQYWYLYALFFLFCIWALLSGLLKSWQITLLTVFVGYGVPILGIGLGSFEIVLYSSLAFGLGTCINFTRLEEHPSWLKYLSIALHVAAGVIFVILKLIEAPVVKELMIALGIYASIGLISLLQKNKIIALSLDFINKYSFQTYLLHTIFTAGIRIILIRINVTEWWLHILLGTAGGLVLSVLAAKIAKKIKPLDFFFFPAKIFNRQRGNAK